MCIRDRLGAFDVLFVAEERLRFGKGAQLLVEGVECARNGRAQGITDVAYARLRLRAELHEGEPLGEMIQCRHQEVLSLGRKLFPPETDHGSSRLTTYECIF